MSRASCTVFPIKESGRQKRKSRERCPHRPADLPEGSNFLGQPHRNRPAEFARTSLSAWGLPTPIVALACIGNVDIQVFSGAGGRLLFLRRLQVYLFIIFHVQPISQGVTLLFFFAEKKKRSKKRKEFAFHLYCKIQVSPEDYTRNYHHRFSPTEIPRRGEQAACPP